MLDILQRSFDESNVFIPIKPAAGESLEKLMNAVFARVNVILAQQELPGLRLENQELEAQIGVIRQEKGQAEALAKAKVIATRIRRLEEEFAVADEQLIAKMKGQNLVLDLGL